MPPESAPLQSFRPRARLLRQLGDELIRNESVAFHELIKNSYDAGAHKVTIAFEGSNKPDSGIIKIFDDGKGMSRTEVETFWLQIGTDNKVAENASIDADKKSKKRRPLGEKGIGRFAVGKLGDHVVMTTKSTGHKEVVVKVDWEEIFSNEFLDQAEIKVEENESPKVFKKGKTGTMIIISRLKKTWKQEDRIEIKRAAIATESPFNKPKDFAITVIGETPGELKSIASSKELLDSALYTFDCTIEGQDIIEFTYRFRPWSILSKVEAKTITLANDKELQKTAKLKRLKYQSKGGKTKDYEIINLASHKIGPVRFSGYVFNLEPKVMKLRDIDPATLKKYMNENGGVRVFRDGIRVYDYGEPGNDWLKLGARRVAKPGLKLDSGLMIGAVNLVRSKSKDLVEKTNREGFIENQAYTDLRDAIVYALDKVELLRKVDQRSIRTYYGGGGNKHEPVVETIEEIREILDRTKLEKSVHEQFVRCLDQVEREYNQITRICPDPELAALSGS